jgi:hypothetical protein
MKHLLKVLPVLFLIIGIGCSKEDEGPEYYLTVEGKQTPLKNTKVYMVENTWDYSEIDYRRFVITDGEFNGTQWISEMDAFDNATYKLDVYIAVPNDSTFKQGAYPIKYIWNDAGNFSSIEIQTNDVRATSYVEGIDVVVKGGLDDKQIITLSFSGDLLGISETNELIPVSFKAKGTIEFIEYWD